MLPENGKNVHQMEVISKLLHAMDTDGQARRWLVREFLGERTTGWQRAPRLPASFLYEP